jgi:hypothetical protein
MPVHASQLMHFSLSMEYWGSPSKTAPSEHISIQAPQATQASPIKKAIDLPPISFYANISQ